MRPPQESPTRHAVSSATPNSSVLGAPEAITSSASSTTAPSTQPPETEPRKCPSSSIAKCEPTGRGAEPQVSTTVAIATRRPASRHCSAAVRMSSSIASMLHLLRRLFPSPLLRGGVRGGAAPDSRRPHLSIYSSKRAPPPPPPPPRGGGGGGAPP